MRNRAFGPIATLLSLVLVTTTTVQAGPISVSEVVQVVGRYQSTGRGPELRLRSTQGANSLVDESVGKTSTNPAGTSDQGSAAGVLDTSTAGAPPGADSLLAGVALSPDDAQSSLDVISQGDLEGSICDCGEIPIVEEAGHGFPKWPLLFLAVIPFFFIHHHCDTCDNPTPTPTRPPPGVPEPASLLLMGSGLAAIAARLRRRHARKTRLAQAIASTEEA